MPTKREHIARNPLLREFQRLLVEQAEQLPACRGIADGLSSFLFMPADKSGKSIRLVKEKWERISLAKVVLINIGSRIFDDIGGGEGTVIGIEADTEMQPLLRIRMDNGEERLLQADSTHGA